MQRKGPLDPNASDAAIQIDAADQSDRQHLFHIPDSSIFCFSPQYLQNTPGDLL